jgi:hypothetical protein
MNRKKGKAVRRNPQKTAIFVLLLQPTAIFLRVFRETRDLFPFEIRGFALEDEWLSFYIRPEDGFQLPQIMQWMKHKRVFHKSLLYKDL